MAGQLSSDVFAVCEAQAELKSDHKIGGALVGRYNASRFGEPCMRRLSFFFIACIFVISFLFSLAIDAVASESEAFTYDLNGNIISDSNLNYIYNDANQLSKITRKSDGGTVAEYYYDLSGKRSKKLENGSTTYYIGDYFEAKISSSAVENSNHYFANNERVARRDTDNSLHFYHNDHLGGTNIVTNSAGQQSEKATFYPYGSIKSRVGDKSKYLFTGQEYDAESNLYYYKSRYYDPSVNRFVMPDPITQEPYNPQNLNKYSYTLNNPIKFVDPSGKIYLYYMYNKKSRTTCSSSTTWSSTTRKSTSTATTSTTTTSTPSTKKAEPGTREKTWIAQVIGGWGEKKTLITDSNGIQKAYTQTKVSGGMIARLEASSSQTASEEIPKAQVSLVGAGIELKLGPLGKFGIEARDDFEPGSIKPPKLEFSLGPIVQITADTSGQIGLKLGPSISASDFGAKVGALYVEGLSPPREIDPNDF